MKVQKNRRRSGLSTFFSPPPNSRLGKKKKKGLPFLFWYKRIYPSKKITAQKEPNLTGETEYNHTERTARQLQSVVAMDSQNRFHFLNLWDDTADESETREGEERKEFIGDEQSVCMGSSQWMNGRPVSGKCVLDGCRLPPAFFLNLSESNV